MFIEMAFVCQLVVSENIKTNTCREHVSWPPLDLGGEILNRRGREEGVRERGEGEEMRWEEGQGGRMRGERQSESGVTRNVPIRNQCQQDICGSYGTS